MMFHIYARGVRLPVALHMCGNSVCIVLVHRRRMAKFFVPDRLFGVVIHERALFVEFVLSALDGAPQQ